MNAELPAAGQTTPALRVVTNKASMGDASLTVAEAIRRFKVSERTVRRNLSEGKYEGAHQVAGPKGELWLIPVTSLERIHATKERPASKPASIPSPDHSELVAELRSRIDVMQALIDVQSATVAAAQAALTEGAEREREKAAELAALIERAARAEGAVVELRRQVVELTAEADKPRKRWWRR